MTSIWIWPVRSATSATMQMKGHRQRRHHHYLRLLRWRHEHRERHCQEYGHVTPDRLPQLRLRRSGRRERRYDHCHPGVRPVHQGPGLLSEPQPACRVRRCGPEGPPSGGILGCVPAASRPSPISASTWHRTPSTALAWAMAPQTMWMLIPRSHSGRKWRSTSLRAAWACRKRPTRRVQSASLGKPHTNGRVFPV